MIIGNGISKTLVSVVVPTRNRPELLLRAVRSALSQTFRDLEVVVVIDGPDTSSKHALVELDDGRVRSIMLEESVGGSEARNIGARAAKGQWIALLDDDDEWLPGKIDRQLAAAEASSARHPLITSKYFCRTAGKIDTIRPRRLPEAGEPISEYMFDYLCYFQTSTLFCSRGLFLEVPFSPDLKSFQDIDWIFRLNRHPGVAVTVVEEPLAVYYTPEERVTLTSKLGWEERLRWGKANRNGMTGRAYSRFIAGSVAGRAVQDGARLRGFAQLFVECIWVGSPTPSSVALLLGTFAVTPRLRRRIRDALFLSVRRSQDLRARRSLDHQKRQFFTRMSENRPSNFKIPSLDGVRALSFLIVFVAHAGLDQIVPGRFGVSIFFLLSGYLITTLLIRERSRTGAISLKLFYARRTLRIFPPLYAVIAGTAAYLAIRHQLGGVTAGGVCSQIFYYQNYWWRGGLIPGLGPLWSLAVEEHFYIFFPPLMLLFFRRHLDYAQITKVLLWVCAGIFVWRCLVVARFPEGLRWARDASDTRADSILFGCALACLEQTSWCKQLFNRERIERYLGPAALAVLLATFLIRNEIFRETLRYSLQSLALTPLLWYVVHHPGTLVGRFLNVSGLARLGMLSYSLYLLHAIVLLQVSALIHSRLLVGVVSFVIAIALSLAMYWLIEKPTEKLRGRLRSSSPLRARVSPKSELVLAPGIQDRVTAERG